ncbi:MAG: hypothetical protein SO016_07765 [Lachnospiraceae bacterium]|nr:hypothetical protein [Robinsoniella sp.]MDY3766572.1 hypothetical protein [Lachnospiraceae bacterium]
MGNENWMNHPNLKNIDKKKLQALWALTNQGAPKSQNDFLPFLMAAASQSKKDGISFSPQEIDTIIEVIKAGKSPEEAQKIDRLRMMMNLMKSSS